MEDTIRRKLPFRAELWGSGGLMAVLEHTSLSYIKKLIREEWVEQLIDGDTIRLIEREED